MLGDQPGVVPAVVRALLAGLGDAPMAVALRGRPRPPVRVPRELFADLAELHGDKAVWKLLEQRGDEVAEVQVPGRVPPDVDTWEDYEALVGSEGARRWSLRTRSRCRRRSTRCTPRCSTSSG